MSTQQLIKDHTKYIKKVSHDSTFLKAHQKALEILKHERFIHLIVTMFISFFCIIFFGLYLFFELLALMIIFVILLVLMGAYFLYYYKLENTVIKWEEIEYEIQKSVKM